ncbi:hypothetical protein AAFN85_25985 [Mucilaginibacter sp. CAU 1740]|uniref:hypothetical protein n=1 Tax=Mucilaginibacter sp. CAU 1740 TaxID=3140365 RepID=UPI00325BE7BE
MSKQISRNIYCFFLLLFISSCTPFNAGVEDSFTEEGCLVQKEPIIKSSAHNINFFLETSGSMAGFMPAGKATEFQTSMWDLIATLGGEPQNRLRMFQLPSRKQSPLPITAVSFRSDLNNGKFKFGQETDIPEMLDSIMAKASDNTVSILVSDLIFSPAGNSPSLLAQFKTDIRTRFAGKKLGSAILQLNSSFYYQKGKKVHTNTPYYMWLMGAPGPVKDLTEKIKAQLNISNEITDGLAPISAAYSILPYAVTNASAVANICAEDQRYYCLTEWDGQTPNMEVALAINLRALPLHTNIRQLLTAVNTSATVFVEQADTHFNLQPQDDKLRSQVSATHFVRLKISGLSQESNLITLNLKDQKPDWVAKADQNTPGLNSLVEGLEQALPRKKGLLARPIRLLITKRTY